MGVLLKNKQLLDMVNLGLKSENCDCIYK